MRTLKLTIAYDGTRYAGWQIQAMRSAERGVRNGKPTIQGTVERALQGILREPVKVIASGRTDAGVHAEAQVAHVRTSSALPAARLLRGVNHLLPADIAVTDIEDAPAEFHARFDAVSKRYRYRIFSGTVVPPFIHPYVHHVRARLDVAAMRREATSLTGRHDFRAFAHLSAAPRRLSGRSTIRTVSRVDLRRRGQELHLELEGNGFLHTMARSIAGTLIDVGRGRLPPGTVARLLRTRARRLAGTTAPAKGLTLVSVTFKKCQTLFPLQKVSDTFETVARKHGQDGL